MSPMNPNQLRQLRQLKHSFVAWHDRANSRVELRNLSDRTLRDIGLTRGNERRRSVNPFWIP